MNEEKIEIITVQMGGQIVRYKGIIINESNGILEMDTKLDNIGETIKRLINSSYVIERYREADHFKLVSSAQKEQADLMAKRAEYEKKISETKQVKKENKPVNLKVVKEENKNEV